MQKKRNTALTLILGLFLINFVSAQYYGGFSLGSALSSIDSSTMILGIIFIVVFAILNYSLSKVFRDNQAIAGIIAFALSLGIIYAVNLTGLDFEGFFYNIGFSEGLLATIVPLILLAGLIYISYSKDEKRFKFHRAPLVLGGLLIIISFTDFIYEKGATFFIGAVFLGIGIWLWMRKKKRTLAGKYSQNYRML